MIEVTALLGDRKLYERLSIALSGRYALRAVRAADDLWDALQERPVALVLIEVGLHTVADVSYLVRTMRTRHPSVPVVAYCHVRRELAREVFALVHAGVHDIVFAGVDDDRPRLAGLVGRAAQRSVAADVTARVAEVGVSSEGLMLLRVFLDAAARPLLVGGVAGALGMPRRTLFQRLDVARLPAPQVLAAWCRLLVAARLLEDPTSTVERVAHDLGFASANALRNLFRRHAKLSPTTLRADGGYAHLRDCFVAHLAGTAVVRRPGIAGPQPRRSRARPVLQGGPST